MENLTQTINGHTISLISADEVYAAPRVGDTYYDRYLVSNKGNLYNTQTNKSVEYRFTKNGMEFCRLGTADIVMQKLIECTFVDPYTELSEDEYYVVYSAPSKSHTRLKKIWADMKQRCFNEKNKEYRYYGGLGIDICDEWLDFSKFEEWALANGYAERLIICRDDKDGNYEPTNCKWTTKVKVENTHESLKYPVLQYDVEGKPTAFFRSVYEAARAVGVSSDVISYAIRHRKKRAGFYWAYAPSYEDVLRVEDAG